MGRRKRWRRRSKSRRQEKTSPRKQIIGESLCKPAWPPDMLPLPGLRCQKGEGGTPQEGTLWFSFCKTTLGLTMSQEIQSEVNSPSVASCQLSPSLERMLAMSLNWQRGRKCVNMWEVFRFNTQVSRRKPCRSLYEVGWKHSLENTEKWRRTVWLYSCFLYPQKSKELKKSLCFPENLLQI